MYVNKCDQQFVVEQRTVTNDAGGRGGGAEQRGHSRES